MRRQAHTARPSLPCKHAAGCPEPAVRDGLCADHVRAADTTHNREHAAYHTTDYRRARKRQLARAGHCAVQLTAPTACDGPATVHHVDHDARNNAPTNLVTLCQRHHMQLEREHTTTGGGPMHRALARATA